MLSYHFLFLIHDIVLLHQLNTFLGQLDGAGSAVVCVGLLLTGVVRDALHPRDWQHVRALLEIGITALQVLPLGEYRAQNAAFLAGAAGLDGIQRYRGGMEPGVVVGAVHAAAEGIMQQRLHVDGIAPRCGQVKVNAEIISGNPERCRGKRRRMDTGALVVQALPVDFGVVLPYPQADIAELPKADAAAHEVLVGVQDQVQQVVVRRHGEKAVDFDGFEVDKEVVQLVVGILGGIE